VRVFLRAPAFTLVALLAIALGIGSTTAVFSLVNPVLIRSQPYGNAQDLVYIWTPNPKLEGTPREFAPSNADFFDWRRLSHSFSSLATFDPKVFTLQGSGTNTRVAGARVTGNFFDTLKVTPALGRAFGAEDDQPGHERVAIIGDGLWRSEFGGDPGALGKTLRLNRDEYKVVGVMPKSFLYPHEGDFPYSFEGFKSTQVWIPLILTPKQVTDRMADDGVVVGRLRAGITVSQAQAEMSAIESKLDVLWPAEFRGWQALVIPFVDSSVGAVRTMLWLLLGAVSLVLLIACSNVANLLAARAAARAHEMGVRSALGAGRSRLIRQMLTEALLLATAGANLGVLVAFAAVRLVVGLDPGNIPRLAETSLDAHVLWFTLGISLLTGFLFGILPAFPASRVNVIEMLKQGGTRGTAGASNRLRHGLIVTEVALAVVLLAGSGLLIRSYLKLQGADTGFSSRTLTASLALDERYSAPQQQDAFFNRLAAEIGKAPGVESAGAVNILPLTTHGSLAFIDVKGLAPGTHQMADTRAVTEHYFGAMGIRLLSGRLFNDGDMRGGPPVFVVSRSFADLYFHGRDPIGQQLRAGDTSANAPWHTVAGVVADVRRFSVEQEPFPTIYAPFWYSPRNQADFAIRSGMPGRQVMSEAREILRAMDPALAFTNVLMMGERVDEVTARRRFQTVVLAVFAGVALFLALVGLYGLMAYAVKRRTAEIGVRMALGATRGQVLGMVLRQGLGLVAVGLALGLGAALALTRVAGSWLYGVSPADPVTFAAVPIFLLAVAACACLIPAWRATRIDPVSALRYE
jgi:predicted permease